MREWKNNEKGMTLIELLAAVAILTVVLSLFATFFIQSSLFTKKNEEAMEATSYVRLVLDELRGNPHSLYSACGVQSFQAGSFPYICEEGSFFESDQFEVRLVVDEVPAIQNETPAYEVKIEIYQSGKKRTETYGLIEVSS